MQKSFCDAIWIWMYNVCDRWKHTHTHARVWMEFYLFKLVHKLFGVRPISLSLSLSPSLWPAASLQTPSFISCFRCWLRMHHHLSLNGKETRCVSIYHKIVELNITDRIGDTCMWKYVVPSWSRFTHPCIHTAITIEMNIVTIFWSILTHHSPHLLHTQLSHAHHTLLGGVAKNQKSWLDRSQFKSIPHREYQNAEQRKCWCAVGAHDTGCPKKLWPLWIIFESYFRICIWECARKEWHLSITMVDTQLTLK